MLHNELNICHFTIQMYVKTNSTSSWQNTVRYHNCPQGLLTSIARLARSSGSRFLMTACPDLEALLKNVSYSLGKARSGRGAALARCHVEHDLHASPRFSPVIECWGGRLLNNRGPPREVHPTWKAPVIPGNIMHAYNKDTLSILFYGFSVDQFFSLGSNSPFSSSRTYWCAASLENDQKGVKIFVRNRT